MQAFNWLRSGNVTEVGREKQKSGFLRSYRKSNKTALTLKQYKEQYILVLRKSNFLHFPISMCGKFIPCDSMCGQFISHDSPGPEFVERRAVHEEGDKTMS